MGRTGEPPPAGSLAAVSSRQGKLPARQGRDGNFSCKETFEVSLMKAVVPARRPVVLRGVAGIALEAVELWNQRLAGPADCRGWRGQLCNASHTAGRAASGCRPRGAARSTTPSARPSPRSAVASNREGTEQRGERRRRRIARVTPGGARRSA